jgi:hypothetical protein
VRQRARGGGGDARRLIAAEQRVAHDADRVDDRQPIPLDLDLQVPQPVATTPTPVASMRRWQTAHAHRLVEVLPSFRRSRRCRSRVLADGTTDPAPGAAGGPPHPHAPGLQVAGL